MANSRLDKLDYYALLQVEREASADQIRQAFHRFARKYHPDRFQARATGPDMLERAAEVYRRGAEAYRVLCHPTQRRQYDQGLSQGRTRFDPHAPVKSEETAKARWPLKVKSPAARPFAIKAERAFKAGDWATCRLNLRMAGNKDPNNPQITAWLATLDAEQGDG